MPTAAFARNGSNHPSLPVTAPRLIGARLRNARPRFRFTLRAMLVATTLVCLALAYQLNWIRQRRAALSDGKITAVQILSELGELAQAPGVLRYFGEQGQPLIIVHARNAEEWSAERERLARLFPEAEIRQDVLGIINDVPTYQHPSETPVSPRR